MGEDARIAAILRRVRTVAVVGASNKPERPSYGVMRFLQAHGFEVTPVNPGLAGQQLLGMTVVARLEDLTAVPDMVDVFRASDQVGPVVDSAIALGVGVVWMQLGVVNEAAAVKARAAGVEVVMDRCPAIEWARLGLGDFSRASPIADAG